MKIIKIGRSSSNDIVINDVTVSSQHAIITIFDTKEIRIKDLNSTNGTYVNSKRITTETTITANDIIKFGNNTFDWINHLNKEKKPNLPLYKSNSGAITQKKSIGRTSDNNIVFNHSDVSSSHAHLIEKVNGEIVIADNGSTNGTYVNGKRISMQILCPGDRILIANKYPLDWQVAFGRSDNNKKDGIRRTKILKTVLIPLAIVAVFIGVILCLNKPWSAERIYTHYKKSVVMIEFAYYYQVYVDGESIGYYAGLQKDKKGNLHAIINNSTPRFFAGTGTGFFVSKDGRIITNRHIVAPWNYPDQEQKNELDFVKEYVENSLLNESLSNDIRLLSKVGKVTIGGKMYGEYLGVYLNDTHKSENSKIPCRILKDSDSENIDIGLIQTNMKGLPTGVKNIIDLSKAVINDTDIIVGKPVYTIGFPAGEFLATTDQGIKANNQDGKITQLRGEYEFGHNISIIGGASGSPVFNEYGKLIGVIHKGFGDMQGYNMAIKAKYAVDIVQ